MRIVEILHEKKFDGVVYYFESNGFSSVSELENFDFDLLYFVPGLDEDIVVEAIELCKHVLEYPQEAGVAEDATVYEDVIAEKPHDIEDFIAITEDNDELDTIIENIVFSMRNLEETLKDERHIKKVATRVASSLEENNREVISIICEELCEKIASAGFSEEEIAILKDQPLADFFATVMLGNRRCGGSLIKYCWAFDKKTMWDLRDFTFDHSQIKGASAASMQVCKEAYEQFLRDVKAGKYRKEEPCADDYILGFRETWESFNENMRKCVINSGRGKTLQYTADELGITRERVRQRCAKAQRTLRPLANQIAGHLLKENGGAFTVDDVVKCFGDENIGVAFLFVVSDTEYCSYISFAKKYVSGGLSENYERILASIASEYIGECTNFVERMEEIESILAREGVPQLDLYDFLSYLLSCGYKMYGDFIVRGNNAYKLICYDVIKRYFADGIKLDASNECQDLVKLRAIVKERYGDFELPDNNRTLCAYLTRMLVLCDRGIYCAAESLQYSLELLDEIVAYAHESEESFVYYDTLFRHFQGRLLMETNINNYHGLHGVLKWFYPDDFQYDRDRMFKIGTKRVSLDQQITNVLLEAGGAMTREEICKVCPYVTGLRLTNIVSRDPGIIQWDYNKINHVDNVKITSYQKDILKKTLKELTDSNDGYCNERQLLQAVTQNLPQFIEENKITSGLNLFYILEYYFNSSFRFSRPHIVSNLFPEDMPLNNMNIGKYFLGQRDMFSYNDFVDNLWRQQC